jgi:hypothetical protein
MIEVTAFRSDHDCMGSIIGLQLRENALHMSFTVFSEMKSLSATILFEEPAATSRNTWISRSERASALLWC